MSEHETPHRSGRITMRDIDEKLDAQRDLFEAKLETTAAEQKTQHTITRAMIALLSLPNIGKALSLLGVSYLHWTEYLPWHF